MDSWIGQSVPRVEDGRLLRGQGQFIADLSPLPGIRHAAILRSPYAHAQILSIDIKEALQVDGVIDVLTGEDILPYLNPFPVGVSASVKYYPLAISKVRYVGEPVAMVVAESRYRAEDALAAINVEYRSLPVALDAEEGLHPPSVLHDQMENNIANHRAFHYGDCTQQLAEADVVLTERFVYPRNSGMPIETYGVVASFDMSTGDYTVWSNFHGPFTLHSVMAHALKVGTNQLRIKTPQDIGGSFGVKSAVYPYMVLMAIASRMAGCPVKWVEDRLEHLRASSSASARVSYVTMGLTNEGKITALKLRQYDDVGAYIRAPEPATLYRVHGNLTGAYDVRHIDVENYAVMTNKVPTGLVRGYGGPQLYFPLERMIDIAAHRLGLDPVEVRMRNLVPSDAFPYTTASGGVYDSGDYQAVMTQAVDISHYSEFHRNNPATPGIRYGIGVAAVVEPSGSNMGYVSLAYTPEERARQLPKSGATAAATVAIDALGGITVRIDSVPEGQGHETVARQIVADVLSVPLEAIRVVAEMDTATSAWSIASGSYSSRFGPAGSSAIFGAASRVREKLIRLAASQLQCDEAELNLVQGVVFRNGDATRLTVKRLAGLTHWNPVALPQGMEPGVYETCYFSIPGVTSPSSDDQVNSSATYGFLVDIAQVAVDMETGDVRILDYSTVHDAGRLLNPALAAGQIYGGLAFGIGSALYEEMVYDDAGQLLTGTFMDYLVPTVCEMPQALHLGHVQSPSPLSPLGAKGLGEGNVMSAGAAIANAVSDALGHEITRLPMAPSEIFRLIQQMRGRRDTP